MDQLSPFFRYFFRFVAFGRTRQGLLLLAGLGLFLSGGGQEAFRSFCHLMHRPMLVSFYSFDLASTARYMEAFDVLCAAYSPRVKAAFEEASVRSEMFLMSWFMTLFCQALPVPVTARVWDQYFWFGDAWLYRCALGLTSVLHARANRGGGDLLYLVTHVPKDVTAKELMKAVDGFRFSCGSARKKLKTASTLDHDFIASLFPDNP